MSVLGEQLWGDGEAVWVGETSVDEDTDTPEVQMHRIPLTEIQACPKATQRVIDDASMDIETWLIEKLVDKFGRAEGEAFVTGDGILRPRGFLTYPTAATPDSTRAWGTMQHVVSGDANGLPADPGAVNTRMLARAADREGTRKRWRLGSGYEDTLLPTLRVYESRAVPAQAAARAEEQGRVQGAASAVESLGRTIGPVWGSASLQRFGEASPYLSAAVFFLVTLAMTVGYRVSEVATEV